MKTSIVACAFLLSWSAITSTAYAQPGLSMPMRRVDTGNLQFASYWVLAAAGNVIDGWWWDLQSHNVLAQTTGIANASNSGASATSIVLASATAMCAQGASTTLVNDTCLLGGFDICDSTPAAGATTGWGGQVQSQGTYSVELPPGAPNVLSGVATVSIDIVLNEWYPPAIPSVEIHVDVGGSSVWVRAIATGWRVTGFLADANGGGTQLFAEYEPDQLAGLHYTATERFLVGGQFNVNSSILVQGGSAGNVSRIPEYSTSFGVALYSE